MYFFISLQQLSDFYSTKLEKYIEIMSKLIYTVVGNLKQFIYLRYKQIDRFPLYTIIKLMDILKVLNYYFDNFEY